MSNNRSNDRNLKNLQLDSVSAQATPDFGHNKFTPKTLATIDEEIENVKNNIDNINKVSHPEVTPSLMESLIAEKNYYLSQKANHFKAVLQEASKTQLPSDDVDVDKLLKQVKDLKSEADNLLLESEKIKYRSLDANSSESDNKD